MSNYVDLQIAHRFHFKDSFDQPYTQDSWCSYEVESGDRGHVLIAPNQYPYKSVKHEKCKCSHDLEQHYSWGECSRCPGCNWPSMDVTNIMYYKVGCFSDPDWDL
jgi:hypothetical protein